MHNFTAECPRSLTDAFAALEAAEKRRENYAIKAGGTDLLVWIKKRAVMPDRIIDISMIPELREISFSNETGLRIGAAATVNETAACPQTAKLYQGLAEACSAHSDQLIRNKATVVGNICSAVPSGDMLPILSVHEAELCLASATGRRFVKIADFILGPRKTVLEKNEIVLYVTLPVPNQTSTSCYVKLGRRNALDLAQVGIACLAEDIGGERRYKITCGAVAPTPVRAREAEEILKGLRRPDGETLEKAALKAIEVIKPIADVRAGKEYRRAQTGELVKRSVVICADRLEGGL